MIDWTAQVRAGALNRGSGFPLPLTPACSGHSTRTIPRPINLVCYNGANGAFTGGDPANTLRVTVAYRVLDLA